MAVLFTQPARMWLHYFSDSPIFCMEHEHMHKSEGCSEICTKNENHVTCFILRIYSSMTFHIRTFCRVISRDTISFLLLAIYYVTYFSYTELKSKNGSEEGIDKNFCVGISIINCIAIACLGFSSCYYAISMKKGWGKTFEIAIRRINQITLALILGYFISSILLITLAVKHPH